MDLMHKIQIDPRNIRISDIYKSLILFVLIVPDDVFTLFTIYTNRTPDYIAYKWLNYSYNIFLLAIVLLGLLLSNYHDEKVLWILCILVMVREIFFFFLSNNSCIKDGSYEIYLTLFTGISLAKLLEYACEDVEELNRFFWTIIIFNVFTVYLAAILQFGQANRYNAVNMDVGSTGTICSLTIIYCLFGEEVKKRMLLVITAAGALFLSGSRVNLLLLVVILSSGYLIRVIQQRKINKIIVIGLIIIMSFSFLGFVILGVSRLRAIISSKFSIARMIASFSLKGMEGDASVLGRTKSIGIGMDIIKNNPWGISGYFTNLQIQTVQRGFPTFPHSSLIDYYIFLGPVIILFIVSVIVILRRLFLTKFSQFMALLYIFIFITISGGPIVNFKLIFIYTAIMIISYKFSIIDNGIDIETLLE